MTRSASCRLAERFESRSIDAASFGHRDHVAAAFAMLRKYPYMQALQRYADTIQAMATNAGAPDKFNVTVTVAFMGLIAERMALTPDADWPTFIGVNRDLLSKSVLGRWYSDQRLASRLAHRQFLLPDRSEAS